MSALQGVLLVAAVVTAKYLLVAALWPLAVVREGRA